MAKRKIRLDQLAQERMPQYSRRQIQSWIMQGKVMIDDKIVTKPGTQVSDEVQLTFDIEEPKFVGRGGFKLEKALDEFNIDVADLTALDAGISTGGFTDCLLQRGVKKVYGVDVGYGQVHERLREDSRVVLLERTNLRELQSVGELVDLVTLDLSFISVLKVMTAVVNLLKPSGQLIVLVKPQFEAGKHEVGAGGIVRDEKIRQAVVEMVVDGIQEYGFEMLGLTESPIAGAKGNVEYLAYFRRKG